MYKLVIVIIIIMCSFIYTAGHQLFRTLVQDDHCKSQKQHRPKSEVDSPPSVEHL